MSGLGATLQSEPLVPDSIHYRLLRYTIESFEKLRGTTRLSGELAQPMRGGFGAGLKSLHPAMARNNGKGGATGAPLLTSWRFGCYSVGSSTGLPSSP